MPPISWRGVAKVCGVGILVNSSMKGRGLVDGFLLLLEEWLEEWEEEYLKEIGVPLEVLHMVNSSGEVVKHKILRKNLVKLEIN